MLVGENHNCNFIITWGWGLFISVDGRISQSIYCLSLIMVCRDDSISCMFQAMLLGLGWSLLTTIITIQSWCVSASCWSPTHGRDTLRLHTPHSATCNQVSIVWACSSCINKYLIYKPQSPSVCKLECNKWLNYVLQITFKIHSFCVHIFTCFSNINLFPFCFIIT